VPTEVEQVEEESMPIWTYSEPCTYSEQCQPPPLLKNLPPVGQCIYCGGQDRLSTEHVVPAGMRGQVTLPESTCESCRKITHKIETECMGQTLLLLRIKHHLHRHKGQRPPTQEIAFAYWNGKKSKRHLLTTDTPVATPLLILEYPDILQKARPAQTMPGLLHIFQEKDYDQKFSRLLALPNVKSVTVPSSQIKTDTFSRWLAKVAYAYAVACLGYDKIKHSPLAEWVRGRSEHGNHLIGGNNAYHPPSEEFWLEAATPDLFTISLLDRPTGAGRIFWVVTLRFLPMLAFPTYVVVVGDRR
jgi:hypothetical protein